MRPFTTSYPREKIKILFLENISSIASDYFEQQGYAQVIKKREALSEEELIKAIKDVHILGIRSKTRLTAKVIKAAKKLQAVGCFCIGVNQVDLQTATEKGIVVFNAPYSNTRSVAEIVMAMAILLIRKIPEKNMAAHAGIWLKDAKGSYELRGKKMGIVGYGNIGMQVGIIAEALGMQVHYFDTEIKLPLGNAQACNSLEELLKLSDIVSLHTPATSATYQLINAEKLSLFKPGALLINYARGEVIDHEALAEAIKQGKLGGAAVDVFPQEPEKNGAAFSSPLQNLPNVMLTPHIGGSTEEAQKNIARDVSIKLFNFLEHGISYGSHTVPGLALPKVEGTHRILHIHQNVPGVLSAINKALADHSINIVSQYLKTNDTIGYVVFDIDQQLSKQAELLLRAIPETIKVRLLY